MHSERSVHFLVMMVGCVAATMAVVSTVALVPDELGLVLPSSSTRMLLVTLGLAMSIGVWVVSRQIRRGNHR
jgi:hypothetical protein